MNYLYEEDFKLLDQKKRIQKSGILEIIRSNPGISLEHIAEILHFSNKKTLELIDILEPFDVIWSCMDNYFQLSMKGLEYFLYLENQK